MASIEWINLALLKKLLNLENILPGFEKIRGHSGQDIRALYRDISLIIVARIFKQHGLTFVAHVSYSRRLEKLRKALKL